MKREKNQKKESLLEIRSKLEKKSTSAALALITSWN